MWNQKKPFKIVSTMNSNGGSSSNSTNRNPFMTTVQIFLWKHWKCFQCSWIKNVFMIIVPIAIAWFQIHVSSTNVKGVQSNFRTTTEVNFTKTDFLLNLRLIYTLAMKNLQVSFVEPLIVLKSKTTRID